MVKQQHQTLRAVTNGKLLTLNILGQYLSLLEIFEYFHRKQTNQAFDVSLGKNLGQVMLFRMASRKIAVVPENLEIFHLF